MKNYFTEIAGLVAWLNQKTKQYETGHPTVSDKEWDDKYFQLNYLLLL